MAQAAGAEAIRHGDDVARRVEATIVERVTVEEGVRALGLETPDSQANFSWIDLGDADEAEVVARLGDDGIVVRAGTPLGRAGAHPRDLRHPGREPALPRRRSAPLVQ